MINLLTDELTFCIYAISQSRNNNSVQIIILSRPEVELLLDNIFTQMQLIIFQLLVSCQNNEVLN